MPKLKQNNPPHGKPKNRTAAEAARLGISEDKLSELVKKGIIPVIKLGTALIYSTLRAQTPRYSDTLPATRKPATP